MFMHTFCGDHSDANGSFLFRHFAYLEKMKPICRLFTDNGVTAALYLEINIYWCLISLHSVKCEHESNFDLERQTES